MPSGVSLEHLRKPSIKPSPDSESIFVPDDPAAPHLIPTPVAAEPGPRAAELGPGTADPDPGPGAADPGPGTAEPGTGAATLNPAAAILDPGAVASRSGGRPAPSPPAC